MIHGKNKSVPSLMLWQVIKK